ncbi:site-specific integrase [Edaphobacter modestus]|uniref:site-specific integrase n=1 Tax=Edaphobacter modestus TaxID=388466 RepID=UPI001F5ECA42|nr:site-specific integrase [Edaphobacter modestus]
MESSARKRPPTSPACPTSSRRESGWGTGSHGSRPRSCSPSRTAPRSKDRALRAHDLRRTCAKLCRKNGGNLEQIKFLLGHSSIQTTERYLGSDQEIAVAVNDNLGL